MAEHERVVDQLSRLQQLGLLSAPPGAPAATRRPPSPAVARLIAVLEAEAGLVRLRRLRRLRRDLHRHPEPAVTAVRIATRVGERCSALGLSVRRGRGGRGDTRRPRPPPRRLRVPPWRAAARTRTLLPG
jgi:hypothetical protein